MWRYQGLVDLLLKDSRFNVTILLCPYSSLTDVERKQNIALLRDYFSTCGIRFIDTSLWEDVDVQLKQLPRPDMLFYPQPYNRLYTNALNSKRFLNKLLCYCPYAINTISDDRILNTTYHHCAWRIYVETVFHKDELRRFVPNQEKNIRVVGDIDADKFLRSSHHYAWKMLEGRKRVIWAPHFSFGQSSTLKRGSFLWLAEVMIKIAEEYTDKLQFCFKPHPRLKTELYKHPEWGKEKTDAYYQQWINMSNSQYEGGEYIDLFMTSDAMIHDCGSFTATYHFTRKPVMFVSQNINEILPTLNDFGKEALKLHYIAKCETDIRRFLDDVVLANNDPMQEEREKFYYKYLVPLKGETVAYNIYQDLNTSLGFNKFKIR